MGFEVLYLFAWTQRDWYIYVFSLGYYLWSLLLWLCGHGPCWIHHVIDGCLSCALLIWSCLCILESTWSGIIIGILDICLVFCPVTTLDGRMEEMSTFIDSFALFWINKDKYLSLLLSIKELMIVRMCGSY